MERKSEEEKSCSEEKKERNYLNEKESGASLVFLVFNCSKITFKVDMDTRTQKLSLLFGFCHCVQFRVRVSLGFRVRVEFGVRVRFGSRVRFGFRIRLS